jgi:hypothetical protein
MGVRLLREVLSAAEPILLVEMLLVFWRSKAYREFPAFGAYLTCRLAVSTTLVALLYAVRFSFVEKHLAYGVYFYVFWVGYLVGAIAALFAIHEIFRHLVQPLPNLGRYGLIAFRWVTLTSVFVALATSIHPADSGRSVLVAATSSVMRCMSVLELCMLAFLIVSMQALHLSARSREFGAALGLGIIAAADLFGSAFAFNHSTLGSVADYSAQIAVTMGTAVWILYFLKPVSQAKKAAIPSTSPLYKWNEVVGVLTESTPQQVALASQHNFFLDDVQKAVDRVLEKNSVSPGS